MSHNNFARVKDFLLGLYDDEQRMVAAVKTLRAAGFAIYDVYTPYAVHSLDGAMGLKRSRLGIVTFIAGLTGLILSLTFQFWTNVIDWHVNIGGKPDNSTLAFIPVSFEITILFGALTTVAAFFVRSRLFPKKETLVLDPAITDDRFVIALQKVDGSFNEKKAHGLLVASGAVHIAEKSVIT
ncbi:MAG: DUF3341 domain-containing protein [Deltaproteobacteria bacterium]|nr:MAG: DUF3341 domain-containing protein [Deltaproteobacteria bacterium]